MSKREQQPNKEKQPRRKRSKRSIFLRVFLVLVFAAVGVGCWGEYQSYRVIQEQRVALQQQMEAEEDRQAELDAKKEYYESDAYIAEVAREQLGLLKPGETVYVNRND